MNANQLKKFAQESRRKLLEQVGAKLEFVLTTDSAELREKAEQVKQLREELNRTTKEQLIEKVAYIWFNRLMALRFMDANEYQPLGIRVITPKDGYTTPELLDEAKRGNIPDDLKLNRQRVYDLLDNRIPSTNPLNEAFKELLIASCNHLNTAFSFLFERINDYTELLLPDDLTSDFSIVIDIREGMPIEDCKNVEIIGWLYQFYISEKKDSVIGAKTRVKKEDIPAATQLFTPRWIVEYMVQNTLGKLWLQNRPKSKLREHMPFFIESASLATVEFLKVSSPEEIKLLDPASGSGHILVYAFDLFTKIYEEEGYNAIDISKLIIEKNLFGFEIDERAAQLSGLALMMKAREYQRRVFRKDLRPNILCFQDLHFNSSEIRETLISLNIKISDDLIYDLHQMQQATNFGSLIIPHAQKNEIYHVFEKLNQVIPYADVFQRSKIDAFITAKSQLLKLTEKYHCVVTNPPYMGDGNMNKELSEFTKTNYQDSKADLMACFMVSGLNMLHANGFLGMINQHTWMFLSSYENLRKKIINDTFIDTLLHLGARTFPEIGGEVVQNSSFSLCKTQLNKNGIYIRLVDFDKSETKRTKTLDAIKDINCGWFYTTNQKNFEKIPSYPIGYWVSNQFYEIFKKSKLLKDFVYPKQGTSTGDNFEFLRIWHEVEQFKFSIINSSSKKNKWFPATKGGEYRKWYGNNDFCINWEDNGKKISEHKSSAIRNKDISFREALTWTGISSGNLGIRYCPKGFLFTISGKPIVANNSNDLKYALGLLCTKVTIEILKVLSPTLSFEVGYIQNIPTILDNSNKNAILTIVEENIEIAKKEWDSRETSWDFQRNELISILGQDIEESCDLYYQRWKNKFFKLHDNEEALNKIFIEIYDLQDELNQNVPLEDITILKDEVDIENGRLVFRPEEVIKQFISYSIGCMFGRYSLDKEGLVIANQGQSLQDYLHIIAKSQNECTFLPDNDNIIPILDDEWFEDDIVARFNQFLKVTFGENNFNKNLAFIEEQIGMNIRKYFIRDFYSDHIKRFKKRPIYWMFSSPNGSFDVLIYMHRYTPDTISNILNKYLKEFIGKLKTRKEHLQNIQVSGSPAEKIKAVKEIDSIDKMLVELHEYERDILFPLATERIAINLDDGVLVNYNKFGKAVKEVAGLNDKVTKKKVKEFDWIDTKQIR